MINPVFKYRIVSSTCLLAFLIVFPSFVMGGDLNSDPSTDATLTSYADCDDSPFAAYGENCASVMLTSDDFESDFGNWNDGGSDCARISNATYANSGLVSARIRDNTSTSVLTSNVLDLSSYSQIAVDFSYVPVSMDNENEDFWLQISTDGGSTYTTVEEWNRGDEFENNIRYAESVTLFGPFSANTFLRFRCDASGNPDWIYLDDIVVSACVAGGIPTCSDGILNGSETGIDCGGPDCDACVTCSDGIQNGSETGVDCGGPDCADCPTCSDGIQNGSETGVDCGGPDCSDCPTCSDGIQNGSETGIDCGGPDCNECDSCSDGIQNNDETGVDCGGFGCVDCPTCTDGEQNGEETGIDCGGPDCLPCETCTDGILNGQETGVDCGGPDCGACATCSDGIQNGSETGVDCGGPDCNACPISYCSSSANSQYEFIQAVTIAGITNSSGNNGGYADFTGGTPFNLSNTVSVSLAPGFPGGAYNEYWTLYVDYNADGDFTDAGEKVFQGSSSGMTTGSFVVPTGLTGSSQMRIQMRYSSYNANSCGTYSWGEVEDYAVDFGSVMARRREVVSNTSLISGFNKPDLELFPNPVRTDLTVRISLEEIEEAPTWFIVDANGRVVQEGQTSASVLRSGLGVDLRMLPAGMYYFSLNSPEVRVTKRFVVQP